MKLSIVCQYKVKIGLLIKLSAFSYQPSARTFIIIFLTSLHYPLEHLFKLSVADLFIDWPSVRAVGCEINALELGN